MMKLCKEIVGWRGCPSLIAFILVMGVIIWIFTN